jgi:AraC family transcriptional regulator, regulatory protein of adaptative response / DNA-3-methyladenine glycosylase II
MGEAAGVLRLPYRKPYDFAGLLAFLRPRAIAGVESVSECEYRRATRDGIVSVRDDGEALVVSSEVHAERVRRMFDIDADPERIAAHLGRDRMLRALVRRWPGARVPGAWDRFELAVRAVVGQQVSVAAATTLMGRLAARFGTRIDTGDPSLTHVFPDAETLRDATIDGMPSSRAATIRALAAADLDADLTQLRGVGPWTASYIAMRSGDADAFPHGDLVLRRAAGGLTARELLARAEAWRPWRAYAAILLWRSA